MKKIHRIIIISIITIIMIMCVKKEVFAASKVSISGPSSVESGKNVTVSITLKNVAAWNINIVATGATSGGSKRFADATEDAMNTTKTFSFTCQSTGEGTINITVTGDVSTEEGGNSDVNTTKTITVNKKQEETTQKPEVTPEAKPTTDKNSNKENNQNNQNNNNKENSKISIEEQKKLEEEKKKQDEEKKLQEELAEKRLESISVNGYELTPNFNVDIDEYFVEVPITEEKINIDAKALSSKATVQGTGEFNVNEGNNVFEVIVTAGNGENKTYRINVSVIDKEPILIYMNGKEYNVIKRKKLLTNPNSEKYVETTIKINNIEIVAFKNSENNEIIINVKDENGELTYLKLQDMLQEIETKNTSRNPYIKLSIILGILLTISVIIIIFMIIKNKKTK